MHPLEAVEIRAFVTARDYHLSRRFDADSGFEGKSNSGSIACFALGE